VWVGFPGSDFAGRSQPPHGSPALPGYGLDKPEYPTKPFSGTDEVRLKQESALMSVDQTTGCDHVGTRHQFNLSRSLQAVFERHATATALGVGSIR
jgi:hypothetical protein